MAKYNPEGPPIDPGGNVPDPENSSDFVVANSTPEWTSKSLTEVKSILGLGTAAYTNTDAYDPAGAASEIVASSISDGDTTHSPDGNSVYDALAGKADVINATAESDFIVAGPSPFEWVKKPLAEVKSILGLGTYNISNLKLVVNAAVNKLDIFTQSGGAAPDANNVIGVQIPNGNGNTYRTRAAAYLSGTSQFILADATNYWSKGSLDGEIKTAYVYAIWDGTGIIWALGGYSGFTRVPASTTVTDDDFFLLEEGSTYTKAITEYCVCVGKIRYQYDTADTPDHTIQATVLDSPQITWNPPSDYGKQVNLASTVSSGSTITEYSAVSAIVKQSGRYIIIGKVSGTNTSGPTYTGAYLKTGSATYSSASYRDKSEIEGVDNNSISSPVVQYAGYLSVGDMIHLGALVSSAAGTRKVIGDSEGASYVGATHLEFRRAD